MTERLYFQPNYPARIDSSDHIGAMARFAVVGMRMPLELCSRMQPAGTIGTVAPILLGNGYVLPSTATTWTYISTDLDPYLSGSFSVFWSGILRSNVAGTLLKSTGIYGWTVETTGWAPGYSQIGLKSFWGGYYRSWLVAVDDTAAIQVVLCYDDSAATAYCYVNGAFIGSGPFTKDPGAIGSGQVFGMLGDATSPHTMATAQAFKGCLIADQALLLCGNPWHIFEPEETDISPLPGTAPPPSFKAAWARNSNAVITGAVR